MIRPLLATILAVAVLISGTRLQAQLRLDKANTYSGSTLPFGGLDDDEGEKVTLKAHFTQPDAKGRSTLFVTADIATGWHIYSITQPDGGPIKSVIKLPKQSNEFKIVGAFSPSPNPEVHEDKVAYPGLALEEHSGKVTWQAPLEFNPGVDPAKVQINGAVHAQVCSQSCLPPKDYKFVATLESAAAAPPPARSTMAEAKIDVDVRIDGRLEPQSVAPGDTVRLILTATPAAKFHIYVWSANADVIGYKPTVIKVNAPEGWKTGTPETTTPIIEEPASDGGLLRYHDQPVSWTIEIKVPADAKAGEYPITGAIGYEVCSKTHCDLPTGAKFMATARVGVRGAGAAPLGFTAAKYKDAVAESGSAITNPNAKPAGTAASKPPRKGAAEKDEDRSLGLTLLLAFAGGIILNFMPCVLPVISLKLFAFMQQGGHDRRQILVLNLWYTLGVLVVFAAIATGAAALHLGLSSEKIKYGEQFTSPLFVISLASIVFVFALSFLGVWEVPIPGFVGSGKSAELAAREGAVGAFAKGIVSTVLATPCSAPLLGSAFGFVVKQPVPFIYLFFAMIGLGMSSPYLFIGAFPRLIRFLPKPGAWMDTFKQVMGFFLLATVAFLFTNLDGHLPAATFLLLVGLWVWCWLIGRTPITASIANKAKAWIGGGVVAAALGWLAFAFFAPGSDIPWQPFSRAALAKLQQEGKTVVVEFTANWCPNCKFNQKTAIDRHAVAEKIKDNGVVPLLADWTHESEDIKSTLDALDSESIPLFAIYPADRPDEPIILRDIITQQQVLDALNDAGPSKPTQTARKPDGNQQTSWFLRAGPSKPMQTASRQ